MPNQILTEDFTEIDLAKGGLIRKYLKTPIGTGDKLAHRIGVNVKRNGRAVSLLGGSCSGYFIRATGDTVALSGTVDASSAYIDLPQACYAIEGPFTLALRIVSGDATGTMLIVDGVVARTTTDTIVDPGQVVPNLAQLLAMIERMEASVSFIAYYEVTTFEEIRAAVQAGKAVICVRSASYGRTVVYVLTALEAYKAVFGGVYGNVAMGCEVTEDNEWSNITYPLEGTVTSVNGHTGPVMLDAADVGAASESALAHTDSMVDVLYKLTKGQAWDIVQDNTTAYQKTIPAGTHLSVLNGWGGRSIVWNQLLGTQSRTNLGVTQAFNNGIFTLSGTSTATYATIFLAENILISGHIYALTSKIIENPNSVAFNIGNLNKYSMRGPCGTTVIDSHTSGYHSFGIQGFSEGTNFDGVKLCFNIHDLTQMGLAGIITTPEKFDSLFPANYYAYNAGEVMHGDVTSIVLKSAQQTTVKTLTVPAAVRALTGYGWSAGSAANTVEYDAAAKKWYYHQRVGQAKIDGTNLYFAGDGEFWNINPRNVIIGKATGAHLNGTTLLGALDGVDLWYNSNNKFVYLLGEEADELGFTSKEDANAKLQAAPTWLYYELATEEVTDITNLMTGFDNYLNEVEPGGALTFVNSNGADYGIPVPSKVDNYRNLSEVTP